VTNKAIESSEMNMMSIKCFNCKQKGHLAKFCPNIKKLFCRVDLEESSAETTQLGDEQDVKTDEAKEPDP